MLWWNGVLVKTVTRKWVLEFGEKGCFFLGGGGILGEGGIRVLWNWVACGSFCGRALW